MSLKINNKYYYIIIIIISLFKLSSSSSSFNILVDFNNSTYSLINLDNGCTTYNSTTTTNTYICSNLNSTGSLSNRLYREITNQETEQLNIYLINDMQHSIEIKEDTSFGIVPPFCNIRINVANKDLIYTGSSIIINDGRKSRMFMGFQEDAESNTCLYSSVEINGITFMNWNMVFVFENNYLKSLSKVELNNRITMNNINFINVNGSIHCNMNEYSDTDLYINKCTFKNEDHSIDNNYLLHLSFDSVYIIDSTFSNLTGSTILNNSSYIKMDNINVYSNLYNGEDQSFFVHYTQGKSTVEVSNFNYYNNHQDYIFIITGEFNINVNLTINNFTCQHNIFLGKYDMDSLVMTFRMNGDVPSSHYFNNISVSNNVIKNNKVPLLFIILDSGDVIIKESNIQGLPYLIHTDNSNITLINSQVNVIDSVSLNSTNIKLNNIGTNIIINSVIEKQKKFIIKIIIISIASLIGVCLFIYLFCFIAFIIYKNIYKEHTRLRFTYEITRKQVFKNVVRMEIGSCGPNSIITNLSLPNDDVLIPPDSY